MQTFTEHAGVLVSVNLATKTLPAPHDTGRTGIGKQPVTWPVSVSDPGPSGTGTRDRTASQVTSLLVLPTSTHPPEAGSSRPMAGRIHGATSASGASKTTRVGNVI